MKVPGDLAAGLGWWMLSIGCVNAATTIMKVYVGRPRPSFYAQCGWQDELVTADWAGQMSPCTASAHNIADSHMSFPSGHASVSANTGYFLALYAAGKFAVLVHKQAPGLTLPTTVPQTPRATTFHFAFIQYAVCMLPIAYAIWVGCTRIRDYRHFVSDVLAGHLLGASITWSLQGLFYNSVSGVVAVTGFPFAKDDEGAPRSAEDLHHWLPEQDIDGHEM